MKIRLEELQLMLEIMLKKAKDLGISEVSLDGDNYWLISSDEREDFTKGEPTPCVGSLVDDVKGLRDILEGNNSPTILDFDRLANLLIKIGEVIHRSKQPY